MAGIYPGKMGVVHVAGLHPHIVVLYDESLIN